MEKEERGQEIINDNIKKMENLFDKDWILK